ncbi:MAG: hypothetical protein M1827_007401 [Pycnora praestabilis]|nr:MAG: hypothetical protein M1827_007401 [Pycnora praestabilis]
MLKVNGDRSRGRSKSPGRGHERSRSRDARAPSPSPKYASPQEYRHESISSSTYGYASPPKAPEAPPSGYSMPSPQDRYVQTATPQYDARQPSQAIPGSYPSYAPPSQYEHANVKATYAVPGAYTQSAQEQHRPPPDSEYWNDFPPHERPGYAQPSEYKYAQPESHEHGRNLSLNTSGSLNLNFGGSHTPQPQYAQPVTSPQYATPISPTYAQTSQYGYGQSPPSRPDNHQRMHSISSPSHAARPAVHHTNSTPQYAHPSAYQYGEPSQAISYVSKSGSHQAPVSYTQTPQAQIMEIKPNSSAHHAPPSPGLSPHMHRLSVSGGGAGSLSVAGGHGHGHGSLGGGGALPPGSPLLEAYHGTYQSISPMPSPMMLPSHMDDGLADLAPLSPGYSSDDSRHGQHGAARKRSTYDPEEDALALVEALRHSKIDNEPLIEILPSLTSEQILALRAEYKKHIKVSGKGINIAKHIKMKVPGALGKACYATALGRWEGEAYWANFWYQSNSSRRELLIESLMGRTNAEIRAIKDVFSDKRYSDSLEKCMKAELKADKFRTAVLLVLEEKRQEDSDYLSGEAIRRDVADLHRALTSKEGGETAMIQIVVLRSDNHLREVLKVFEQTYRKNFAREMLKKSTNLVGELLAHILNGILNRPVRDALLLHQALSEQSKERADLLISRLVRLHWERAHMERVKVEYQKRYGRALEEELEEGTKGDFGEFLGELVGRR